MLNTLAVKGLTESYRKLTNSRKSRFPLNDWGTMGISSQHITGFAIGLGVAALGFVIFRKFQGKGGKSALGQRTDQPLTAARDEVEASLKELMLEKERLEELIAERELAEQEDPNRLKVQSTSDVGL